MTEWQVEARPVIPELVHPEVHADYTPTPVNDALKGVTVGQRLDTVMRERLRDMFGTVT